MESWRVPVVYLTAFSDSVVLEDIKTQSRMGTCSSPFNPNKSTLFCKSL